ALPVGSRERAHREQLPERAASVAKRIEHTVDEAPEPALDLDAGAADRPVGVTAPAPGLVEDRAQALVDLFNRRERLLELGEVLVVGAAARQPVSDRERGGDGDLVFEISAPRPAGDRDRTKKQHPPAR